MTSKTLALAITAAALTVGGIVGSVVVDSVDSQGNRCQGLANGVVQCASDPSVDAPELWARTDGHWTHTDENLWIFCPSGRSDVACGA